MRRRDFVRTGSVAATTIGLTGCLGSLTGGGGGDGGQTFQIFVPRPQDHFTVKGIDRWGNTLSEETDGRLSAEHVEIGSEEEGIDAVSSGSVDGAMFSMTALTQTFDRSYDFLEGPFVTQSWEHFDNMAQEYVYGDGGFNDVLVEQGNVRVLDSIVGGWRGITANKPVHEPADVDGLTMRLPQFESWVQTWETLGIEAEPIPTNEIYQAIETGVVDASEGPITQMEAYSLQEVQSHFSQLQYLLLTFNWTLNEDTWQSLSEDDKDLVTETLAETTQWQNEEQQRQKEQVRQELEDQVTFVPPEEMDREKFYGQTRPVLEDFFADEWGPSRQEVMDLA